MIVAISYHDGDLPLMRRWANHVLKLGSYKKHTLVLIPIRRASTEGVLAPLTSCFGEVMIEPCDHAYGGWPQSCNMAFETMGWLASTSLKKPFLWMEPDAIPLTSDWIDSIESEYLRAGRPFMGSFVEIAGVMPNGVNHMSGVAVYHWDLHRLAPSIFNNEKTAWDIASASNVIHQMHTTSLIHHDWVPTKKWRRDEVTKDCVNPLAVIYHPDKLGVLISDGSIPNDVQGDPAIGAVLVAQNPHETKEEPNLYAEVRDMIIKTYEPIDTINAVINYAKTNSKAKKELLASLVKEGLLTKASCAKLFASKKAKSIKRTRKQISASLVNDK